MKQPTKDILREQLALAADEIIRLRGIIGHFQQFGFSVEETKSATWIVHNNYEIGVPLTMDYMEIDGDVVVGDRKPWWRRLFS